MLTDQLEKDIIYTKNKLTEKEWEKLKGCTFLITGCAGFIGFYIVNFLYYYRDVLHLNHVICLDNFMLGRPKWLDEMSSDGRFIVRQFDVISENVGAIAEADNVDYVIHMASIASPIFYRQHPLETIDANVWGLRSLLEYYKEKQLKGFLFFSSSEIYGNPVPERVPTDEEYYGYVSFTGPRSCYDESKRFGETICMLYAQRYKMPIGIARPFNNFGPGMKINDKRVPADFALNVLSGKKIEILSDGTPRRTFCYISDSAVGYFKILLYGKYDYFNIGIEAPEITIIELAEIYKKVGKEMIGYKGEIVYNKSNDKEYLTNNPQRRCPKIKKARSILGFEPTISVEKGVRNFLTFLNESPEENKIW